MIPDECSGLRLDQVLTRMIPGTGRRGTRRSWEHVFVLVDGRRQRPGYRVHAGQRVTWEPREKILQGSPIETSEAAEVAVAAQNGSFAALVKPAGMHSEALSGSLGHSVESSLPALFPQHQAVLVNRLDQPVSGLLLVALTGQSIRNYADWQDQGLVRKRYLAVVHGHLERDMEIRAALDTARRRKVRVLPEEEPDALRWTSVSPLSHSEETDETLVLVDIYKGSRHQIRAHLAAAGHLVKSDPLYGAGPDQGWIYLHHCGVCLPGFDAWNFPGWADWQVKLTRASAGSVNSPVPWQNPRR